MPRENTSSPWRLDRRGFLRVGSGLVALPLVGCGGDDEVLVARTSSGSFRGQSDGHVSAWLGIPYAQPPVGALRFRSPQPVIAADGVVDATQFGAASVQTLPLYATWIYQTPVAQSEDCLTVNVWAPTGAHKAPVVVWLHGGAWRTGASSMPLMNGRQLAQQGVVVVTVNFRLGSVGGLAHEQLADPQTGAFANWQLQDQLVALQWVNRNIAAFGGDPSRVCLIGQSAGGTSAALLAQNPAARPLIQRVVLLSPAPHAPPAGFNVTDAQTYTELVAARLGTDVLGLRSVPAADLHAAELAQNAAALPPGFTSGFVVKLAPVIDGLVCRADWLGTAWPSDLPVMITNTLTEGSFFLHAIDPQTDALLTPPLPQTSTALTALVTQLIGPTAAPVVIAAYTDAAANEGRPTDPGAIWIEIYGDRVLRWPGYGYASRLAAAGVNVRYGTHAHSIKAPGSGVPHCADVPFLFGTYGLDFYRLKFGSSAIEQQLSTELQASVVSFASGSEVGFGNGVVWPEFGGGTTGTAALIGADDSAAVAIESVPKTQQMAVWGS